METGGAERALPSPPISSPPAWSSPLPPMSSGGTTPASPAYPFKALALYAAVAAVLAVAAPRPSTGDAFGAANRVTLWRVAVACLFAGLIGEAGAVAAARAGLIAGTALFFCLDGLDGWLARRAGAASAFGRHFDHETDALFVLVLALLVYDAGRAGPWGRALGRPALRLPGGAPPVAAAQGRASGEPPRPGHRLRPQPPASPPA